MLGADIAGTHLCGGLDRQLNDALGARGHALRRRGIGRAAAGQRLDLLDECLLGHAGGSKRLRRRAAAFAQQTEQQVLGADIAVAERIGRFLGERQRLLRTLGKTILIKHEGTLLS